MLQSTFKGNNAALKAAKRAPVARANMTVRASGTDYGLGLQMSQTALKANGSRKPSMQGARAPVPLELEEVRMTRRITPTHAHARAASLRVQRTIALLSPPSPLLVEKNVFLCHPSCEETLIADSAQSKGKLLFFVCEHIPQYPPSDRPEPWRIAPVCVCVCVYHVG